MAIRQRFNDFIWRPTDAHGLGVFRCLFGILMCFAILRFWLNGWIETLILAPRYHFHYAWFPDVSVPAAPIVYGIFITVAVSALLIACGRYTRMAAFVFFVGFTYLELLDKSLYLNHYYLISIIAFLLIWVPSDRAFSLRRQSEKPAIPIGVYQLFRIQIGLVYVFAGLAKLNSDWLIRGEPLGTWLATMSHFNVIGPLLSLPETALFMSWAGAVFDLTICVFLIYRKTRTWAYVFACIFHVVVGWLFPIGIFSFVMMLCATIFFDPNWCRAMLSRHSDCTSMDEDPPPSVILNKTHRAVVVSLGCIWIAGQCLVPLRFLAYEGPVNWTEVGFRFAWRVMLVEKTGTVDYRIHLPSTNREFRVYPRRILSAHQVRILPTQPDMIIEFAQQLGEEFELRYGEKVEVFADAFVSFNGRPSQPYLDPGTDLNDPNTRAERVIYPLVSDVVQ